MNKLFDYEYYKNKLWEHFSSYIDRYNNDDSLSEEEKEKKINKVHKRYNHSLGVVDKAVELIQVHELPIDIEKAKIAAVLHDYAKFETKEEFEDACKRHDKMYLMDDENFVCAHALIGRYIVEDELDIQDEEILSAIELHTTGESNMTPLQEVIYIADCVEDGRSDEYFIPLRKMAKRNIKKAIAMYLSDTFDFVTKNGSYLNKKSISAYNYYKKYLVSGNESYEKVLSALDHNLLNDIKVYDARNFSPLYDYIIVGTTLSERQMNACVSYLKDDFDIRGIELGETWTLIDLNDVIVHVFKLDEREKVGIDRIYAHLPLISINKDEKESK